MKSIQFFGAAGTVTGSSSLLTSEKTEQILIDCGMFQGDEKTEDLNYQSLGFNPPELSAVFLTHAHLDHCGRLPLLTKSGFVGKIYATRASRMLAGLVLSDSAKIAVEDAAKHQNLNPQKPPLPVLYTEEDVEKCLAQFEEVEYDHIYEVGDFKIIFRDAGHILGSASIEVSDSSGKTIVFSGDLGNTPEDIIRPTESIKKADFVVMESTYGDRFHTQENPTSVLQEEINIVEKSKGVLLIPSFSIERAQEIIHRLNYLKNQNKIQPSTKIFLDSPMAIKALEIFRRSPELFNHQTQKELKTDDPFNFPGLVLCQSAEESKSILLNPAPKVIISGSGMMSGGRILHHAANYLHDPSTRLLLVGFQAPGTLGKFLEGGLTRVRIYQQEVFVKAHVRMLESMSCHADQTKLLNWLGQIKGVQKVFLNHGEDPSRKALAERIASKLGLSAVSPHLREQIIL